MVSPILPMRITEAQTGHTVNSWPGMGTEAHWLQSLVLTIALPTSYRRKKLLHCSLHYPAEEMKSRGY